MTPPAILRITWGIVLLALVAVSPLDAMAAEEAKTTKLTIQGIELNVPTSWASQPPANNMRLAQFGVPGATPEASAELVISSFGGTVDANLNRWVAQFAAEGREVKVTQGKSPQGEYYVSDVFGTFNQPIGPPIAGRTKAVPGTRAISVMLIVPEKGTFFLKLTGPDATVKAAAEDLRKSFGGNAANEVVYTPK